MINSNDNYILYATLSYNVKQNKNSKIDIFGRTMTATHKRSRAPKRALAATCGMFIIQQYHPIQTTMTTIQRNVLSIIF